MKIYNNCNVDKDGIDGTSEHRNYYDPHESCFNTSSSSCLQPRSLTLAFSCRTKAYVSGLEVLHKLFHTFLWFTSAAELSNAKYINLWFYGSLLRPRSSKPTILYRTAVHVSDHKISRELLQLLPR